jgi:hypothetical protein
MSNCACASHAVPMVCLDGDVVMWWRYILAISISPDSRPDFGDAPDQTQPNWINRDRARSNPIGPDISPKNAENARFLFFAECPC